MKIKPQHENHNNVNVLYKCNCTESNVPNSNCMKNWLQLLYHSR